MIRSILKKTHYELWKGRKPNVSFFHVFGCKCFILNIGKDNLGKFDSKLDETFFLGYSTSNKVFWVLNKRTLLVQESVHVAFDESSDLSSKNVARIENIGDKPNLEDLEINHGNMKHQERVFENDPQQETTLL